MSRGKQEKETEEEGGKRGARNRGDTRGTIERRIEEIGTKEGKLELEKVRGKLDY